MDDRENNVYRAKLAEQAERYDGMCLCLANRLTDETHFTLHWYLFEDARNL